MEYRSEDFFFLFSVCMVMTEEMVRRYWRNFSRTQLIHTHRHWATGTTNEIPNGRGRFVLPGIRAAQLYVALVGAGDWESHTLIALSSAAG